MKKNLALILALVMLMGTIFAVIPVSAAAESSSASSYEPVISYANISYDDKLNVMFAVPAPTGLADDETVKVIVWANKDASEAFSYKDQIKTALSAEETKATINGKEYLVFKYDGLAAADMTDIIVARPVIVETTTDTAVVYGDIVEYSVLEYVATAKGEFGATALSEDVLTMLDAMLVFGSLAQQYSENADSYDFFANEELAKIWYIPVINGVEGERVFGGFYKKGAELATVETIDAAAAQSLYRAYRALLIKDWDSYLGCAK